MPAIWVGGPALGGGSGQDSCCGQGCCGGAAGCCGGAAGCCPGCGGGACCAAAISVFGRASGGGGACCAISVFGRSAAGLRTGPESSGRSPKTSRRAAAKSRQL